jgi:hypothetical protein
MAALACVRRARLGAATKLEQGTGVGKMAKIGLQTAQVDADDLDLIISERVEPAAAPRKDALAKSVEDIRECLTEQIRLLAQTPEFGNKSLIANCAHVSLMMLRQLSLRYGRP